MLRSGYRALCARRDQLIMHKPSTGPLVENFDGVRAVAATMVFLQHALPFPGVVLGPAGVWLFFTLSGYLLYLVFLRMEAPLPNSSILVSYLVRRVFRLAPLYIAFLLFHQLFWLTIVPDAAWNGQLVSEHLLLLRADDHLWSIKTEMVFYLFLPLLIMMLAPLVKPNYRLVALAIIAMLTWWFFEHKRILVLHGGMPYFTPFILGMMMVHVQPHVKPWMGRILALVGFLAILGFGIDHPVAEAYRFSIGFTQWEQMWSSGHYVYWACALLVLGVASYKSRFWGNPWLRLIGVVGYGFYLWHPLVIVWYHYHELPVPPVTAFVISVGIALAGYILIERPGMRLGKYLASKVAADQLLIGFRWVSICLVGVAVYVATRHIFALDSDIRVRVSMYGWKGVLSQVFVTSESDYTEENSSWIIPDRDGWQELTFTVKEQSINRLRFDPGDEPGTYEINSMEVSYPYARGWESISLDGFQQADGITRAEILNGTLIIETEFDHADPVLIHEGGFSQPWYRPWHIFWTIVLTGTIVLVLLCRLLDRVSGKYAPRMDGKALVPT